jgi:site-specific recombinase XerD
MMPCMTFSAAPFSKRGFQAMVERAGEAAGFDMKIHPHTLRHALVSS